MPTVHINFPVLCVAGVLLSGCGPTTTVVDTRVLRLQIDEYSVKPPAIQVTAGRLKIVLTNTGILTHNLRLAEDRPSRGGSQIVLGGTPAVKPGQTVIAKVPETPGKSLKPGNYKLIDSIANHTDLGDYATLVVK